MDKNELLERFCDVNKKADGMLKKAFSLLADASPKAATEFLECLEGCADYKNYLSEAEALVITKGFKNDDGSNGAKWSPDALFSKVQSFNKPIEMQGYYNKWSLYAVMNMENSDAGKVLRKWTEGDADKYAEACYDLAVARLMDVDRPHFVREYFDLV